MSDEKDKKPHTVADHVAGLKRYPPSGAVGAYTFPLIPAGFIGFVLGLICVVAYLLVAGFTKLFWMGGVADWMMDQDRSQMLFVNLVRICVALAIVIYFVGVVLAALERRRENMS